MDALYGKGYNAINRLNASLQDSHFGKFQFGQKPGMHKTIFEHAPGSRGAQDYDALLDELMADGFIE